MMAYHRNPDVWLYSEGEHLFADTGTVNLSRAAVWACALLVRAHFRSSMSGCSSSSRVCFRLNGEVLLGSKS